MPNESVLGPPSPTSAVSEDGEMSLLDVAIVVAKHKRLVVYLALLAGIVATVISLLLPEIYTAQARILPPQQSQSSLAAMVGQLGVLAGGAGGALGIKNPADVYVGLLKSRTIADRLIERFRLQEVYKWERPSDVRKRLESNSNITAGKDGFINIEFDDQDPKRAAAVANAYIEELIGLTDKLAVTEAGQRRVFFERQLEQAKKNLVRAEIAARQGLEKGGLAMVDAQGKSLIATTAFLRAQIAAKEVEIDSMRGYATEQNPALSKARQELKALRQQMSKLESGSHQSRNSEHSITEERGLRNVSLLRDVKYYEFLFELLSKQYEMARIDEAKEGAVIQVVDQAIVPDRRSSPKRRLIVMLSFLGGLFLALVIAFFQESYEKALRVPETGKRLDLLRRYLRMGRSNN